jgi:hypothetical protein
VGVTGRDYNDAVFFHSIECDAAKYGYDAPYALVILGSLAVVTAGKIGV